MSRCQVSKRARDIRKQAIFAGLAGTFSHPSHIGASRWKKRRASLPKMRALEGRIRDAKITEGCSGDDGNGNHGRDSIGRDPGNGVEF